ncbi:MAG: AAA family ATPase, partial [Propionibacteriaceae bacterium]|nr:AAA family ATPase [Propionibacteriaceae bacterium]
MQRTATASLRRWKAQPDRKPLLLSGARQVGKTWLAQEFGRTDFANTAYVNFLDNENMQQIFAGSLSPERLLRAISIEAGQNIDPTTTLVILDEIQESPRVLTSLKMFNEQMPELAIIAAGSLLGVALHQGVSFPVGKVNHLDLYPMTFTEFLDATDEG